MISRSLTSPSITRTLTHNALKSTSHIVPISILSTRTLISRRLLFNQINSQPSQSFIHLLPRYFSTSTRFTQKHDPLENKKRTELVPFVTKATLLSQANSKLSRMLVHIKWPLLRNTNSTSKWDVMSAFISWLVMGNILWVILGTTTFGLVLMYSLHYLNNLVGTFTDRASSREGDDESDKKPNNVLGYLIGSIISFGLGVNLKFEKGSTLPEFKDGKLRFKNFTIVSNENTDKSIQFKGKVEAMDITLSFNKWYEGNGLIYDLELFGLNGKLYKSVRSTPDETTSSKKSYRLNENIHYQFDLDNDVEEITTAKKKNTNTPIIDENYIFDHVKIYDSYLEIYEDQQAETPLKINIFSCDLPKLRGNKIVLDFFNANNASGAINDSMFTIHKRQNLDPESSQDKLIRFKLDAIDLGEINKFNPDSKFNWIVNGKAEIIADITLPEMQQQQDDLNKSIGEFIGKIYENIFYQNANNGNNTNAGNPSEDSLLKDAIAAIYHTFKKPEEESSPKHAENSYVMVNVKMKLYDLKASLPQVLPTANDGTPFISLTDLRSLISFINTENQKPITIKSTVIEKITDLSNIEHLGQTKMFDYIMGDVYEEMSYLVRDDARRIINEKSWSNSVATQLLILGLGAIV
ncbi:hypothetical protein CTRG_05812 [Candida tropicalis MYA-3404]|uniref:Mitochondrial distribution and morphology protein 31 n=1 Tax=Candida tropicalis (strain ATCC MYA-3404 / T1) TaxID=294747 RepID=C5MIB9_CANTT|nr:hypothetical protein CTRG_05812 [Candida tropicalis MYA-3404]EER30413.1 hypothetical protein CTRG_05812 [Candida tropicalis MYA-3404]KAG4406275.1 hypothetical protein JTP64_003659 [Candida tropicalis]